MATIILIRLDFIVLISVIEVCGFRSILHNPYFIILAIHILILIDNHLLLFCTLAL